ncbi:hypothetical protein GXM_08268 [Nostoc sphaeroides CCNUC1]|uniref:Uncharacterized protein n=1 Tax=Nostoc sphaeroides CCNUC1 TaxID=2653204 RepID=A0A5P8WDQ2_9NOSO|nr:hypothetical protein GXM_08268 [Nostoc sphaeroides CCNUC1]
MGAIALLVESSFKTAEMLIIYTSYQFVPPFIYELVRNPGSTM